MKSLIFLNPANLLIPKNKVKKKLLQDVQEVTIDSVSSSGNGVGRIGDLVVFIPFTAPGDVARIKITNRKKNYAEGELLEIIKASIHREQPPCPVFGQCGGCQWQHISYEEQRRQKQSIVEHALTRIAKEVISVLPIIPSQNPYFYRNRARFRIEGSKAGFYRQKTHDIVTFEKCFIVEEPINSELKKIKQELAQEHTHLSRPKISRVEISIGEDGKVARDKPGFSQINTLQNLNMQKYVCEIAGTPPLLSCLLLDLYCGHGNFSFPLQQRGWQVHGIDSSPEAIKKAIEKAKEKAKQESGTEITFSAGDCAKEIYKLAAQNKKFHTILLDPPRTGIEETMIESIKKLSPKRLIYISCNPATFARDWARLKSATNLSLKSVQPFDLFPQTFHVELIALAE